MMLKIKLWLTRKYTHATINIEVEKGKVKQAKIKV